jgi:hypothetical protein
LGLKNKKREINNRNKETCNKGNLIMESRGHRVKSKKESAIKELLKIRQLHFRKVIKSMRGDLGTLGVILGATIGGVREMSLLFKLKKIILEKHGG